MFIFASLFAGSAGMTPLSAEERHAASVKKMLVQGVTHPSPKQDELVAMAVASVGGEGDEESTEKHWRERRECMHSLKERIRKLNNRLGEVVTQTNQTKLDLKTSAQGCRNLEKAKSELQSTLASILKEREHLKTRING